MSEEPEWLKQLSRDLRTLISQMSNLKATPVETEEAKDIKALDRILTHEHTCTDPDCMIKRKLKRVGEEYLETQECPECESQTPKGKYCIHCGESTEEDEW